jgi:hypothetical protein
MSIEINIAYTALIAVASSVAFSAVMNLAKFMHFLRRLKSREINAYVDRTGVFLIDISAKSPASLKIQDPSLQVDKTWYKSLFRRFVAIDRWFSMDDIPSTLDEPVVELTVDGNTKHGIFGKTDPKILEKRRIRFIRSPVLRIVVNGQSEIVSLKQGDLAVNIKHEPGFTVTPVKENP